MNIDFDIFLKVKKGEEKQLSTIRNDHDCIIEYSFTPNNLYYIMIDKDSFSSEDLIIIHPRKIQQIIHGYIVFKGVRIDLILAEYFYDNHIEYILLQGDSENANLDVRITKSIPLNESRNFVIDYDEIQLIPEFTGKTLIEYVKYLIDTNWGSSPDDLFNFYYSKRKNDIFSQIQYHKNENKNVK